MNDRQRIIGEQLAQLLPRLRRFARALARHPQDADDLVQLAIERALVRYGQWKPGSSLVNWMLATVRNAWIDEIRSRRRRAEVLVAENEADDVGAVGTEREIELWSIQSALMRLPGEQRQAVALVLIEGCSYREAAEIMEVPIGTLMSRLARGRVALQGMLKDPPASPGTTSENNR
jgi:RNA polymerase sigma-70 factor (ECF subfamily)